MTSDTDTHPYSGTPDPSVPASDSSSTAETAKSEAQNVASTAVQSGGQVLDTAKSETSEVVAHAGQNARELFDQVRGELTEQAGTQQQRVAAGLHDLARELEKMGEGSGQSGIASSLVQQASERTRSTATWLENRDAGDLVTEVRRYAARKPGTFLAAAAALGFLGARLTRGLTAASSSPDTSGARPSPAGSSGAAFSGAGTPAMAPAAPVAPVDDDVDEDVPMVTTMSHGEPVRYPTATGGTAGSFSTPASGLPSTSVPDGFPEGRA